MVLRNNNNVHGGPERRSHRRRKIQLPETDRRFSAAACDTPRDASSGRLCGSHAADRRVTVRRPREVLFIILIITYYVTSDAVGRQILSPIIIMQIIIIYNTRRYLTHFSVESRNRINCRHNIIMVITCDII